VCRSCKDRWWWVLYRKWWTWIFKRNSILPSDLCREIFGTADLEGGSWDREKKFFQFQPRSDLRKSGFGRWNQPDSHRKNTNASFAGSHAKKNKSTYAVSNMLCQTLFWLSLRKIPIEQAGNLFHSRAQLNRFFSISNSAILRKKRIGGIGADQRTYEAGDWTGFPTGLDIKKLAAAPREVHIDSVLLAQINSLIRSNSNPRKVKSKAVQKLCGVGAGTRAGQALILCCQSSALVKALRCDSEDIQLLAYPVLRKSAFPAFQEQRGGADSPRPEFISNIWKRIRSNESK